MHCFLLFAVLMASASPLTGQSWSINEKPLPTKITALSEPEKSAVLAALQPSLNARIAKGDLERGELTSLQRGLHVKRVVLTGGSILLVQAWGQPLCGATGNCSVWVLDKDHRLLLDGGGGESISVMSSYHRGKPDILFAIHISASDTGLERWRFNGSKYVLSWCATSSWGMPFDNWTQPHLDVHSCSE